MKGLTLSLHSASVVTFDHLKRVVVADQESDLLIVTNDDIQRTKDSYLIKVSESKIFIITGVKRKRVNMMLYLVL